MAGTRNRRNDALVTPTRKNAASDMDAFGGAVAVSIGKDQAVTHGNADITAPIRRESPTTGNGVKG